jgi:hypothetical protein
LFAFSKIDPSEAAENDREVSRLFLDTWQQDENDGTPPKYELSKKSLHLEVLPRTSSASAYKDNSGPDGSDLLF